MSDNIRKSFTIADHIIDTVVMGFEPKGDMNQMKVQIAPIISNALYEEKNNTLETERLRTLFALARVMPDAQMELVVKTLGYSLTHKNK